MIPTVFLRRRRGGDGGNATSTPVWCGELNWREVGLVVDAVFGVLRIPRSVTEPPPPNIVDTEAMCIIIAE
ncbi:MAG TPA: hypothetical protein DGH68_06120 [Bacteroidetes bacterium]|nr:hypothetical protein [Bacteroidota bacterium]